MKTRVLMLVAVVALPGVGVQPADGGEAMKLKLESPAFRDGEEIPEKYTADGADISPPLEWSVVPEKARSLVLVVDDPDAPDPKAPKMTWVHWVVFNLPPGTKGLAEGVSAGDLPEGAREGLNDWKRTGYGGPAPPIGRHRYRHKLYALDVVLANLERPTKARLEAAMKGHVLAETVLTGTYARKK